MGGSRDHPGEGGVDGLFRLNYIWSGPLRGYVPSEVAWVRDARGVFILRSGSGCDFWVFSCRNGARRIWYWRRVRGGCTPGVVGARTLLGHPAARVSRLAGVKKLVERP